MCLEQALPCLLHLENWVSETLIEHLLWRGLRWREGNVASTSALIAAVEYAMKKILELLSAHLYGSFL